MQKTMRGTDPEVQKRIIEGMVNHIREELRRADHYAKSGDMDATQRRLDRLREYVKQRPLPPVLFNEMKEAVRRIEVDGQKKMVDLTLEKASEAAKTDDKVGRATQIKVAREHLNRAVALGAGDDFRKVTEQKIEIIMLTDSGKDTGSAPKQDTAPKNTIVAQQEKKPSPNDNETRRFKRYTSPVLEVELNGGKGKTSDWSLGGLAIEDFTSTVSAGKKYDVIVRIPGDSAAFKDTCEVIKADNENRKAIVRFLALSSATLLITQKLTKEGKPIEE